MVKFEKGKTIYLASWMIGSPPKIIKGTLESKAGTDDMYYFFHAEATGVYRAGERNAGQMHFMFETLAEARADIRKRVETKIRKLEAIAAKYRD